MAEREPPLLSRLRPPPGAVRERKRLGRGVGSGLGKTAGKGTKGQKARHPGRFSKIGFEGGQTPLQRRLPKRGFVPPASVRVAEINVRDLVRFGAGSTVDEGALRAARLVRGAVDRIKLLGQGEVRVPLVVRVHAASASAREKIERAGGRLELVGEAGSPDAPSERRPDGG
ncbi:MAG: 50S ribosomal protein L15 [Myxococcota bacterium]|nr:50S ribosomal protein L15 [Myxococcota bacterium]MDW8363230.1 50S ribosomal protein L15 [Myxococcales bacterium]